MSQIYLLLFLKCGVLCYLPKQSSLVDEESHGDSLPGLCLPTLVPSGMDWTLERNNIFLTLLRRSGIT